MAKIIITGANGFIGRNLVDYLNSLSHVTIAWVRNEVSFNRNASLNAYFDVSEPEKAVWPSQADALIHCAWIMYEKGNDANHKNLKCVEYLSRECYNRGIQFIFISSFSADPDAQSNYGKTKFKAEKIIQSGLILKPGLVVGDGGVFGRMQKMVDASIFLPLPGIGNHSTQIIWVTDLCRITEILLVAKASGSFHLAHHEVVTLRSIYNLIVRKKSRFRIIFPLPFNLLLIIAKLAGFSGIRFPINTENLLGIRNNKYVDTNKISNQYQLLSLSEAINL